MCVHIRHPLAPAVASTHCPPPPPSLSLHYVYIKINIRRVRHINTLAASTLRAPLNFVAEFFLSLEQVSNPDALDYADCIPLAGYGHQIIASTDRILIQSRVSPFFSSLKTNMSTETPRPFNRLFCCSTTSPLKETLTGMDNSIQFTFKRLSLRNLFAYSIHFRWKIESGRYGHQPCKTVRWIYIKM